MKCFGSSRCERKGKNKKKATERAADNKDSLSCFLPVCRRKSTQIHAYVENRSLSPSWEALLAKGALGIHLGFVLNIASDLHETKAVIFSPQQKGLSQAAETLMFCTYCIYVGRVNIVSSDCQTSKWKCVYKKSIKIKWTHKLGKSINCYFSFIAENRFFKPFTLLLDRVLEKVILNDLFFFGGIDVVCISIFNDAYCSGTDQTSNKLFSLWSVFRTLCRCLICAWSGTDQTMIWHWPDSN